MFETVMDEVHRLNAWVLKDKDSAEYRMESTLLQALAHGPQRYDTLSGLLESTNDSPLTESDFAALIYAMRKEGLIEVAGDLVRIRGER